MRGWMEQKNVLKFSFFKKIRRPRERCCRHWNATSKCWPCYRWRLWKCWWNWKRWHWLRQSGPAFRRPAPKIPSTRDAGHLRGIRRWRDAGAGEPDRRSSHGGRWRATGLARPAQCPTVWCKRHVSRRLGTCRSTKDTGHRRNGADPN